MKTKINKIWEKLENDNSFRSGILLRRYSSDFLPNVFIAVKYPENFRCLAAIISVHLKFDISSISHFKDISIEIIHDEKHPKNNILLIKLINYQFIEVFSVLCEDLISNISTINDELLLVNTLLQRIEKWKSLFEKASMQGLSPKEQRGLFGEIFFLRMLLMENPNYENVIKSWVGPEKRARDFQLKNWGVEVKTTSGNNHQLIQINSERQLDTSNLKNLFLFHISLEINQQSGESLNHLVDTVYKILDSDIILTNKFSMKLMEAGYYKHHRNFYNDNSYFLRSKIFYKIKNEFPRIEEKDIRKGVGDVKYTIDVSLCTNFIENEKTVFKIIIKNE